MTRKDAPVDAFKIVEHLAAEVTFQKKIEVGVTGRYHENRLTPLFVGPFSSAA